jgi:hypothetical protein
MVQQDAKDKTIEQLLKFTNSLVDILAEREDELVMGNHNVSQTALHLACKYNISDSIIAKLIDIGGRQLVGVFDDNTGETAISYALKHNDISSEIIKKLIMATDDDHHHYIFHTAFEKNTSTDLIKKMIDNGGRKLVMATDGDGFTSLCSALIHNASIDVIDKLVDVGGRELVVAKNSWEQNSLHMALTHGAPIEVIEKLLKFGGNELLLAKDDEGVYVLHICISFNNIEDRINKLSFLILRGIQYQIGGEFGLGGIFNFVSGEDQNDIYEKWNDVIVPALEMDETLSSGQPILQAAIIAKAPLRIIRDIISRFDSCISTTDSMGRYPINVGIIERLKWDDGMEDIVRAFTAWTVVQGQSRLMINVAALYGLPWRNGMRETLEESMNEVGNNNEDTLTGLLPFMLAAMGDSFDFDSIYELIRASPQNVKTFNCLS